MAPIEYPPSGRAEERRRQLLHDAGPTLFRLAATATVKDLLVAALDLAEELTGSRIGFFHFIEDDQKSIWLQAWSRNTVANMCTAEGAGAHYPIEQAGVWADCIRDERPTVHNDYASVPGKKGLPEGHAPILRELVVPVSRAGRVAAVLGVGNKPTDYTEADVAAVSTLADLAWDIAARKRSEEALRASEARLRATLDSPAVGVAITSPDKGWIEANDRTCEMLGYSRDELFRRTWLELTHPDDAEVDVAAFNRVLSGEIDRYSLDKRFRRKDGSTLWTLLSVSCVRRPDGSVDYFVAILDDITERKRAERELQRSEAHFRQLVAALPIPIAFSDSLGNLVTLNARFTQVLGYTRDDLPTIDEWFRRAYPDEGYRREVIEGWDRRVRGAAVSGGETPPREYRVTCKGGEVRTMSISAVSVGQDLLVTMLDVTEARSLQEKLALTERLAAMGTLVAGVAHEINNPLAGVLAGQAVAREVVEEIHQKVRSGSTLDPVVSVEALGQALEALDDAQEGGARVASIVKDLTALGRPGENRSRIRLASVVSSAMQWLPATVAHRAAVTVDDRGAPDVLASKGQIEQVLVNLVTNAANATPQGKRDVICIRLGPGTPGMARLEVVDHGSGISPATLRRIFEPFFTTRPVGKGTGLGLAICQAIVTALGGALTVETEVGKGSTFRVELPVAPAEA